MILLRQLSLAHIARRLRHYKGSSGIVWDSLLHVGVSWGAEGLETSGRVIRVLGKKLHSTSLMDICWDC